MCGNGANVWPLGCRLTPFSFQVAIDHFNNYCRGSHNGAKKTLLRSFKGQSRSFDRSRNVFVYWLSAWGRRSRVGKLSEQQLYLVVAGKSWVAKLATRLEKGPKFGRRVRTRRRQRHLHLTALWGFFSLRLASRSSNWSKRSSIRTKDRQYWRWRGTLGFSVFLAQWVLVFNQLWPAWKTIDSQPCIESIDSFKTFVQGRFASFFFFVPCFLPFSSYKRSKCVSSTRMIIFLAVHEWSMKGWYKSSRRSLALPDTGLHGMNWVSQSASFLQLEL